MKTLTDLERNFLKALHTALTWKTRARWLYRRWRRAEALLREREQEVAELERTLRAAEVLAALYPTTVQPLIYSKACAALNDLEGRRIERGQDAGEEVAT